jgi:3-phenylpropionate/cinnamic acid dioxygenase small subunit
MDMSDALQNLIDENEIQKVLTRYTQMVDQKDWGRMDEIFVSDATLDYASSGGESGPYKETLAWLARALEPWPLNLHVIGNFDIRVEGDTATSTCYFLAPMGREEESGEQIMTTNGGMYHDQLVRTELGWRIRKRICEQTILTGLPKDYEIPG